MIVQMKMRTGVDAFGTLSDNWSGLDLGPTLLSNQDMKPSFPNDP